MSESGTSPMSVDRRPDSRALLPSSLVFADTPSRFVAYFLDSLLLGVINAIPLSVLGFHDFGYLEFADRGLFVSVSLLVWAIQIAYFLWFWTGGRRATPGQRLFSIQVGNAFDGAPLKLRPAVIRYLGLGSWITIPALLPFRAPAIASFVVIALYLLGLIASVVASPTKQGLHDRLAGSAVVRPARADRKWAVRVIWILLAFALLEVVLLAWSFLGPGRAYIPPDFWQRYLDWFWPS